MNKRETERDHKRNAKKMLAFEIVASAMSPLRTKSRLSVLKAALIIFDK